MEFTVLHNASSTTGFDIVSIIFSGKATAIRSSMKNDACMFNNGELEQNQGERYPQQFIYE